MHESVILSFIVFLGKKIFEIYNNSFIEKIIKSICEFFKKASSGSFICELFKNKFLNGEYWRKSVIFKIITSPIRLLFLISAKIGEKLLYIRNNSRLLHIFDNILNIPICEFGLLSAAFTVGSFITLFTNGGYSKINIIYSVFMIFVSVILLIIPCSVADAYETSGILKFFASIFNGYEIGEKTEKEYKHIEIKKTLAVIFFIFGLFAGLYSPIVVLISVVAVLGAVLILSNTLIGIFLTVLAAPILPTMLCAGIVALTAVSFVFKLMTDKNKKYIITPMSFLTVSFLALAAFSAVTSFNVSKSVQTFVLYAVFTVPYFMIVNSIKTKNQWYNLVVAFIIAGFIVGLYGLYQNFFMDMTNAGWVDENMFTDIGIRVYSTFDNPNVLGQYLVLSVPVSFSVLWSVKKTKAKFIFTVITAVMLACLMLTWSRAAWVGIVLAIGFFLLMKDRRWSSLAIVALLILPFVLPESIMTRITSIGNMKDSSTAYRVSIWVASLRMAKDYWLSGIGLGTGAFERVYQHYALNGAGFALHSHNFYIELVVEMGILGLILFLLIIFSSYKQIISIKDKNSVNKNVALAIGGALIGYLFQGIAENLWYNYRMILIFWIVMAILQTGAILAKDESPAYISDKEITK